MPVPTTTTTRVPVEQWTASESAHEARVDAATAAHRDRQGTGRKHPVEDFLFTYYGFRPARLRRWHPGAGVALEAAEGLDRAGWKHYRSGPDGIEVDVERFVSERAGAIGFVRDLLTATSARAPQLGCFGLHEWAMVYRLSEEQVRHADWPLRLGREGTDAVVESMQLRCTHHDAYRFYPPPARSLNLVVPTRDSQVSMEQPGCLHGGMDLYKWAYKLVPVVPSTLVMDCFDLAREIRRLDMRAAPYDLRELGYEPVQIETPEGRATYAREQRAFAERGQQLRVRLLEVLADLP